MFSWARLALTENTCKLVKIHISQWYAYKLKVRPKRCIIFRNVKTKASKCNSKRITEYATGQVSKRTKKKQDAEKPQQ